MGSVGRPDVILMIWYPVMTTHGHPRTSQQAKRVTRRLLRLRLRRRQGLERKNRALAAGCNECVLKPVDSRTLAAVLQRYAPAPPTIGPSG